MLLKEKNYNKSTCLDSAAGGIKTGPECSTRSPRQILSTARQKEDRLKRGDAHPGSTAVTTLVAFNHGLNTKTQLLDMSED